MINENLKQIRMLLLDVDGVLTDGLVYYLNEEKEARAFHIHDGMGLKMLQQAGIKIGIISGKQSKGLERRIKELNIVDYYLGSEDKLPAYLALKTKYQFQDHEFAYMGDDLPDLPILKRVGFAVTVAQAPEFIKAQAQYVTKLKGGNGAVREITDMILQAQDHYQKIIDSYIQS